MKDGKRMYITFKFKITQDYNTVLALEVDEDTVPEGVSSGQYLKTRVNTELDRVLLQIPLPKPDEPEA